MHAQFDHGNLEVNNYAYIDFPAEHLDYDIALD